MSKKNNKKPKPPPYIPINVKKEDIQILSKCFKLRNGFTILTEQSILKPEFIATKFKRLTELRKKCAFLFKTVPAYVAEVAAQMMIEEIKDIKQVLQRKYEIDIKVTHKRASRVLAHHNVMGSIPERKVFSTQRELLRIAKRNLRNDRSELRDIHSRRHSDYFEYIGKEPVHAIGGQILAQCIEKKTQECYKEKKPMQPVKYIGVEIEFCAPIKKADLGLKILNAGLSGMVHLKGDGSLRPKDNEEAFEVAMLIPEKEFKAPLKKLCDLLLEIGAQTEGRRCGLHVHFDMRKRAKETVYFNLVSCQKMLWQLVDKSRENNEFCQSVSSKQFPKNFSGDRNERYKSINSASYYKHKTLEIRMHEGTTDFYTIKNWITILSKIVNRTKKLNRSPRSINSLKRQFKIDKNLAIYLQDRVNYRQINSGGSRRNQDDFSTIQRHAREQLEIVRAQQEQMATPRIIATTPGSLNYAQPTSNVGDDIQIRSGVAVAAIQQESTYALRGLFNNEPAQVLYDEDQGDL